MYENKIHINGILLLGEDLQGAKRLGTETEIKVNKICVVL